MDVWSQIAVLSEFEGIVGEAAKISKEKFDYHDLATGDDNIRAKAIDWITAHAKDEQPFFMYLNFQKVHNPNNPSPRWKESRRGRQLPGRIDGAGRQHRPGGTGNPRSPDR